MAYNFKSIADVEVVAEPTKNANVLIEEDGVIKKAPKAAVGGAGGSTSQTVIITVNGNAEYDVPAPEGLYEKLQDMFNGNSIIDIVIYSKDSGYNSNSYRRYVADEIFKSDNNFEGWFNHSEEHLIVYPNGKMAFFYDN